MVASSSAMIVKGVAVQSSLNGWNAVQLKGLNEGNDVPSMLVGGATAGHARAGKTSIMRSQLVGLKQLHKNSFGGVEGTALFRSQTFWDVDGACRPSSECRAAGGKGQPAPEDEDPQARDPDGRGEAASPTPSERDWRTFRAQLVAMEREDERRARERREGQASGSVQGSGLGLGLGLDTQLSSGAREGGANPGEGDLDLRQGAKAEDWVDSSEAGAGNREVGARWAHPLAGVERGCILVATELLDGYAFFERAVILLLSTGGSEAPYGLVLNKAHSQKVGNMAGMSPALASTFGPCRVNIGGPIDDQRFLLLHSIQELHGFDEVVPGMYYGGAAGMEAAVSLVNRQLASPEDFRFFFGYAGWDAVQLQNEINLGWWHVAACSSDIVLTEPKGDLWTEMMRLMGGPYAESVQSDVQEA